MEQLIREHELQFLSKELLVVRNGDRCYRIIIYVGISLLFFFFFSVEYPILLNEGTLGSVIFCINTLKFSCVFLEARAQPLLNLTYS